MCDSWWHHRNLKSSFSDHHQISGYYIQLIHIVSDVTWGLLGLSTIIQHGSGDPARVYKALTCVQVACVIHRSSPSLDILPFGCLLCSLGSVFDGFFIVQSCDAWETEGPVERLANKASAAHLHRDASTLPASGTLQTSPYFWPSSSCRPPPSGHPRQQSAPAESLALMFPCLALVWSRQWFLGMSCFPRLTFSCQTPCSDESLSDILAWACGFSPALINAMAYLSGCCCLDWLPTMQMKSVTAFRTWSWCQW